MPDLSVTLTHNLGKVEATFGVNADVQVSRVFRKALGKAGRILQKEVVRGYSGDGRPGWAPLHGFTVQEKGHALPLLHKGELMDHVVVVQDDNGVAVGFVDPTQALKALIHENGATVPVTPRMRAFLASRGFLLKADTKFLVIPARRNFAMAIGNVLPELVSLLTEAIDAYYRKAAI